MSGHSKWSTIKRRKGAEDAKRGKIFTRLGRDIMIATREGGSDENSNAKLRIAVLKARSANMPKDNIERAIKKGTGDLDGGVTFEELTYEGYGMDGIAFIVEVMTDNKNRALAEVKNAFNKNGGNMASAGAVAWQFDQKGYIALMGDNLNYDEVFMVAAEAGADDVVDEDGSFVVYTPREAFFAVEQALSDGGYQIEESELRWIPQNETEVTPEVAIKNMRLMERIEDLDDVQSVATNMAITGEALAAYESS